MNSASYLHNHHTNVQSLNKLLSNHLPNCNNVPNFTQNMQYLDKSLHVLCINLPDNFRWNYEILGIFAVTCKSLVFWEFSRIISRSRGIWISLSLLEKSKTKNHFTFHFSKRVKLCKSCVKNGLYITPKYNIYNDYVLQRSISLNFSWQNAELHAQFHPFFSRNRVKSEMLSLFLRNEKWKIYSFHSIREVKSEMIFCFTLFEKWKWN